MDLNEVLQPYFLRAPFLFPLYLLPMALFSTLICSSPKHSPPIRPPSIAYFPPCSNSTSPSFLIVSTVSVAVFVTFVSMGTSMPEQIYEMNGTLPLKSLAVAFQHNWSKPPTSSLTTFTVSTEHSKFLSPSMRPFWRFFPYPLWPSQTFSFYRTIFILNCHGLRFRCYLPVILADRFCYFYNFIPWMSATCSWRMYPIFNRFWTA